jgi:TonB family protein
MTRTAGVAALVLMCAGSRGAAAGDTGPDARSGCVPSVLVAVAPDYPPVALRANVQGAVVVEVSVNDSGVPAKIVRVSGPPILDDAAIQSAKEWRFSADCADASVRLTFEFASVADRPGTLFHPPFRVQLRRVRTTDVKQY